MDPGNKKAVVAAMVANGGIAIAKFVGFAITGAASMLAEAVHSVADTGNQGLLLWGGAAATRAATPAHPFGYGRERYFWAFVVALVIFSLGGMFALYEGIKKLSHPHPIESAIWAAGILIFGILLEGNSFRIAVREARHDKGQHTWWSFIRHSKSPELPVVLLEDLGALVGLVLALIAVTLAMVTGDSRWDAIGSIAIGILLLVIGTVLAFEMKSLLIGEGAGDERREQLRRAIEGDPNVVRVIHMRTQFVGPEELLVGARVEFSTALGGDALVEAIDAAEARVRSELPVARLIYLEPGRASDIGDHPMDAHPEEVSL